MIVTTAYRPNGITDKTANQAAKDLGIPFVVRNKRSIPKLHEDEQKDVLVAAKERLEFYPMGETEPFFFHPSSAAFRTKRPLHEDPLIKVSGLEPGDSFVDCTLGMATDAIVVSQFIGAEGHVTGCESNEAFAYIVHKGLKAYTAMPHLTEAMRRIDVIAGDAVAYLAALPDNAVDVIYMDPMFTQPISESSNFKPVRSAADTSQLTDRWVNEATRVATKSVVLKAHFRSEDFEAFGFHRRVRPNTKFHYGVIDCRNN